MTQPATSRRPPPVARHSSNGGGGAPKSKLAGAGFGFRTVGRAGSAVVEFALTAPFLVSLLLGMSDLAPSMMAKFKLGTAAQTVADLASQSVLLQLSDIVDIYAAGGDVMAPFSTTPLVMRVTNVASDGKGRAFVYWSCGQGVLPPYTARSTVTQTPTGTTIANNLLYFTTSATNTSYLVVEAQYTYSSPAGLIFPSPQVMSVVAYSLPRVSTYIGFSNGVANYVPVLPTLSVSALAWTSTAITCSSSI